MKKELKYILILCFVFSLYFIANKALFSTIYYAIQDIVKIFQLSFPLTYLTVGLPVLIFVYLTNNKKVLEPLGLKSNIIKGIFYSFIFSLPMFLGYGISGNFEISLSQKTFWIGCVFAAFFEEFYYRGFFFGLLFKNTKLGFFLSLFLSAVVFASLHLYQSNEAATLIGIFITTFLGAGLFAWLYVEWNFNLWISIGLHFFMNLSWSMFTVSENAFGGWYANLIRIITIIFAIAGTIYYKKKQGIPLALNRNTLFLNK